MTASLLDAFDTVVLSDVVLSRLRDAQKLVAKKQQLADEKQWLGLATERLAAAREGLGDLATRSARLPELESVRPLLARSLQNAAIDAVEKLQAGITFHAGPRAPVLEELFGSFKLPALRKAAPQDFEKFLAAFSKRLKTQYVRRIFADPDFSFAMPAVAQLQAAFEAWRGALSTEPLPEGDEASLREQLGTAAQRLELPLRQARLLAEAALLTLDGAFAESGIGAKAKKRASAPAVVAAVEQAEVSAPVEEPIAAAAAPADEAVAAPPAPKQKKKARKARGTDPHVVHP